MQFKETWEKVVREEKNQSRRLIKGVNLGIYSEGTPFATDSPYFDHNATIDVVMREDGRVLYEVGKTYAVQPGRGKKSVGRIRITGIRREDVRSISDTDVLAEGFQGKVEFLLTWCKMHDKATIAGLPDGTWLEQPIDVQIDKWMQWLNTRPAEHYQAWVIEFELEHTHE